MGCWPGCGREEDCADGEFCRVFNGGAISICLEPLPGEDWEHMMELDAGTTDATMDANAMDASPDATP